MPLSTLVAFAEPKLLVLARNPEDHFGVCPVCVILFPPKVNKVSGNKVRNVFVEFAWSVFLLASRPFCVYLLMDSHGDNANPVFALPLVASA